MRLLLLGCTGLVGRELIPMLLQQGHELVLPQRLRERRCRRLAESQLRHTHRERELRRRESCRGRPSGQRLAEVVQKLARRRRCKPR